MATPRENIQARIANVCTELEAVKNTDRHWNAYKSGLLDELERLTKILEGSAIDQQGAGTVIPFEEASIGLS